MAGRGRPKKYRTEAERLAAHRAASRKSRAKKRGSKVPDLQSAMKEALSVTPSPTSTGSRTTVQPIESSEALPAVDIPSTPTEPADSPTDAPSESAARDSAGAADSGSSTSSAEPSQEPSASTETVADTIAGDKLAKMGAAAWCKILETGSGYAQSVGALGIPPFVIEANFEAMEFLLLDALKESNIDKKKYAAYVCVGSGAWVGGNCYYGYYTAKQAEKAAAKAAGRTVIDGSATHLRSEPASGAANGSAQAGPAPFEADRAGVAAGAAPAREYR